MLDRMNRGAQFEPDSSGESRRSGYAELMRLCARIGFNP